MKHFGTFQKLASWMLVLALLLSICAVPAQAVEEEEPIVSDIFDVVTDADNGAIVENTSDDGLNQVNLTIGRTFKVSIPVEMTEEEAKTAAEKAVWSLVRDENTPYIDKELYPNQLMEASLEDVKCSDKKTALYTINAASAETVDDVVYLTLDFSSTCYFGKDPSAPHSNGGAYLDPCGYFFLTATVDGEVVGQAPIKVAPYDAFHTMNEIYEELDEIVAFAAENTSLYVEKFSMGESQGDNGLESLDMPYLIIAKNKEAVEKWQSLKSLAENNPAELIKLINSEELCDYQVPVMYSNVHANEVAASDAIMNFTWMLMDAAAGDGNIDYKMLTGFTEEGEAELAKQMGEVGVEGSVAVPDLVKDTATYLGYLKGEDADGKTLSVSGVVDMEKYYNVETNTVNVNDLLNDVFYIIVPEENVEGRTYVTRTSSGGFDLNRDNSFQTQNETQNMTRLIAEWNPVSFTEFHGRVKQFQCEPCDPPHEPNFEYDLLAEHLVSGGEILGIASVANNDSYNSYVIPQRDYLSYTGEVNEDGSYQTCWYDPWDDMSTSYTPQYAMLHGTVSYTVEFPAYNDAIATGVAYGQLGQSVYIAAEKASYLLCQVRIFERGVNNFNSDAYELVGQWFCDQYDVEGAESDLFRPEYDGEGENGNFYPECYIIPMDGEKQSNLQAALDMVEYLTRNGVKVNFTTEELSIDGVSYPAGTAIVSMYQAKRSVANGVLYNGTVITEWPVLYSEGITAFNHTRGFDMAVCAKPAVYEKISASMSEALTYEGFEEYAATIASRFTGVKDAKVILVNASNDSTSAVNSLLQAGKSVGMILAGDYAGSFVCDYADWETASNEYLITGIGVAEQDAPLALEITKTPILYICGKPADNSTGFVKSSLVSSAAYNYDRQSMELLNFATTDDPSKATLIIGAGAPDAAAVAAIKSGTPYIGYGSSAISSIAGGSSWGRVTKGSIFENGELVRKTVSSSSMDALAYVTYESGNIVTASYVAEDDDILYGYGAGYFEQIPAGSEILIRMDGSKEPLEGFICSNGENYNAFLNNSIQAIAYQKDGMNLILFANTLTNKVHQQDEFNFVANHAFSSLLGGIYCGSAKTEKEASALADVKYFDVNEDYWFASAVGDVSAAGLMIGTGDYTFAPFDSITRAEIVMILYRLAGSPAVSENCEMVFSDVLNGQWYTDAIKWASAVGVVNGMGDGTFRPNQAATREQIVTIMRRFAALAGEDVDSDYDISNFADYRTVSAYAETAMKWACENGYITGSAGYLLPTGTAERSQVATIMSRILVK